MDLIEELKRLGELKRDGLVSDEEFSLLKEKLLSKDMHGDAGTVDKNSKVAEIPGKSMENKIPMALFLFTAAAGFALSLVFKNRYDSNLIFLTTLALAVFVPVIIYFFLKARILRGFLLVFLCFLYTLAVAYPVESEALPGAKKVHYSPDDIVESSQNPPTLDKDNEDDYNFCGKHGIRYYSYKCPNCEQEYKEMRRRSNAAKLRQRGLPYY